MRFGSMYLPESIWEGEKGQMPGESDDRRLRIVGVFAFLFVSMGVHKAEGDMPGREWICVVIDERIGGSFVHDLYLLRSLPLVSKLSE